MPNQRSKDKRHLGGFVHKKLYAKVLRWAKKDGMDHDRFGFAAKLITEGINKREKREKKGTK